MGADEAGTLAALKQYRDDVFNPAIAAHNGRIVKLMGDGAIVEFASIVDAVNCALSVQQSPGMAGPPPHIVLRIGINLGDVIIEGDDIYGDGVNIAARLEPLAEPSGICISSIVNESVGNRIDERFIDAGEIMVKNVERPIRIWKWHPATVPKAQPKASALKPTAQAPSIAVLPFTNMSGDPEQEYFSDGISEDIITDLSKIGGLLVISRNSSFTYKGRAVDVRAGNRVRITAQLIDTATGGHLWADRYDRNLTDIFQVQDEVTRHIVEALKITLKAADNARLAESATTNINAYDCFLRGRDFLLALNKKRENFEQAIEQFAKAVEIDRNYSQAYAGLSWAYIFDYQNRWSDDPPLALGLAKENAQLAIAKDANEPFGHFVAALVALFEQDFDRAQSEADQALSLNPNYAMAYNTLGSVRTFSGRPLEAIPLIEKAMRLDPAYGQQYQHFLGVAYLLAGKYETAAAILTQRILLVPETDFSRAALASALGHLGEFEQARRVWSELKEINPRYTFKGHFGRQPFKNKSDLQHIAEGLAAAGLPTI
jgi:adenylate cyclase